MTALLHYEDFAPGQNYVLEPYQISAEEIVAFASEFDPQPQHTDPEAAKQSILGSLSASGWHLCALAIRLIVDGLLIRAASQGAPGVEEVQWRRPVHPGDTLHMSCEVLETRPSSRPSRGMVRFRFIMWRGEERVMLYTSTVILGRRVPAKD